MTCPHCRPPRLTRAGVLAGLARDAHFRYQILVYKVVSILFEAARDADPDERGKLRELARTLRAGARFAQRGSE